MYPTCPPDAALIPVSITSDWYSFISASILIGVLIANLSLAFVVAVKEVELGNSSIN